MPVALHFVSVVVHIVTLIFTAAALAGAEGEVAWSLFDKESVEVRYGLLKFRTETEFSTTITAWDSRSCTRDTCDDCHDSGVAVIVFLVIALVGNVGTTLLILAKLGGFYHYPMLGIVGVEFTLALLYLICWASWAGGCHQHLEDADSDISLSAGFALTFLCFVSCPAVALLQKIALDNEASASSGGGAPPSNAANYPVASSSNAAVNKDEKPGEVVV